MPAETSSKGVLIKVEIYRAGLIRGNSLGFFGLQVANRSSGSNLSKKPERRRGTIL